jgi:phosphoribosylformylglycinamidine cyclo-ligase
LRRGSWPIPPIFGWLQKAGNVAESEMYRVFNMGIGFVMIVSAYYARRVVRQLADEGYRAWEIGEVRGGEKGLEFEG